MKRASFAKSGEIDPYKIRLRTTCMLRFGKGVYTNKPDYKRNLQCASPSIQSQLKIQLQRECLTIQEPPFRQTSSNIRSTKAMI